MNNASYLEVIACPGCGKNARHTDDSAFVNEENQFIQKHAYTCEGCGQVTKKVVTHGYDWQNVINLCKELKLIPEEVIQMIIKTIKPELLEKNDNEQE